MTVLTVSANPLKEAVSTLMTNKTLLVNSSVKSSCGRKLTLSKITKPSTHNQMNFGLSAVLALATKKSSLKNLNYLFISILTKLSLKQSVMLSFVLSLNTLTFGGVSKVKALLMQRCNLVISKVLKTLLNGLTSLFKNYAPSVRCVNNPPIPIYFLA